VGAKLGNLCIGHRKCYWGDGTLFVGILFDQRRSAKLADSLPISGERLRLKPPYHMALSRSRTPLTKKHAHRLDTIQVVQL